MRRVNLSLLCLLALTLLVLPACTNNSLDDGDSANVVLEVLTVDDQPVTAGQQEDGVCSGDGATPCSTDADCALPLVGGSCVGATCTLQVQEWRMTVANVPKTELATTSPFNDVLIQSVQIAYSWPNGFTNSTVNLGSGVVIPANSSSEVTFYPLTNEDLAALVTYLSGGPDPNAASTAFLTIRVQGQVLDSDSVSTTAQATLNIEACF